MHWPSDALSIWNSLMCLRFTCLFALRVHTCPILCLCLILITKTNKAQRSGVRKRCCQPAIMEKILIKAQMVQWRAKYYQKLLSQQAALVSQPPARLDVSNPPPLWGLKFLLSTSGPAWWAQTGLEFCPHANSFPPYCTVPGWQRWHWTHRCERSVAKHATSWVTLTGIVVFLCVHPPQTPLSSRWDHWRGLSGEITIGSKCFLQSVTAALSPPRRDSQEKRQSNVGGKASIWTLEMTKSAAARSSTLSQCECRIKGIRLSQGSLHHRTFGPRLFPDCKCAAFPKSAVGDADCSINLNC